jgi:long-subunit acyl-CoA synthetase (AMP-forming)
MSYAFVVWDLALISMGAVSHVFPESYTDTELDNAVGRYALAAVAGHQAHPLLLPGQHTDELIARLQVNALTPRVEDADLLTRVYSSGTTGHLKGLLISRAGASRLGDEFIRTYRVDESDRHLIFLPLSHFQQRLSIYVCLQAGVSCTLTPYTHVFHDIRRFAPTFLIGPPAFYEAALNMLVTAEGQPEAAQRLAMGLGGKIRFAIAGMAPIRRSVLDAFARHGVRLLEAYGITEVGLVAWNTPEDNEPGTVGRPLGMHEILLSEDSEILVRTQHHLSQGYFDVDAALARQTFLDDGVIATGDVGELIDGRLVLRGRRKDVIVTSGGTKFHPTELEELLLQCAAVRQAAVVTDSDRGEVAAVISVDDSQDSATVDSINKLLASINVRVDISKRIARAVLITKRFTVENSLLTRTLKPNRAAIVRSFIDART